MRRWILAAGLVVTPQVLTAQGNVAEAVQSITAEDFVRRVGIIAHDSMRGRNTPSPGLNQTAAWAAGEFRRLGLSPGGPNGTYIQSYPLREMSFDVAASRITLSSGVEWTFGDDVVRIFGGPTGRGGVSGPVVVVTGTPSGTDAFENIDVEGAVAVVIGSPSASQSVFRGLLSRRPAAILVITEMTESAWENAARQQQSVALTKGWGEAAGGGRGRLHVFQVKPAVATPALNRYGVDVAGAIMGGAGDLTARRLRGLTITVQSEYRTVSNPTAPNVVGILEGSDPVLKDEYIVFSGHMDHVGAVGDPHNACREVAGDGICNGADDDASGTVGVIEAAEAFAMLSPRPRRSMLFLLVSGEEKGLWGSEYFANNPTVPLEQIVADLNTDMIGRNWPDTIVAIGKEHSDLGETLNSVNTSHPELNMNPIDDIWPEQNFYRRSDHFNFARNGVPILFFFNGTHDDYHRPSDQVSLIDGDKASRIVKLVFYLGLEIANRDERPQWNPDSYRAIVGRPRAD